MKEARFRRGDRVGKEAAALTLRLFMLYARSFAEKDATNCYRVGFFTE